MSNLMRFTAASNLRQPYPNLWAHALEQNRVGADGFLVNHVPQFGHARFILFGMTNKLAQV
jgi:hypothetical protein